MSESWIFKAAVKLPPNLRKDYLDQACGGNLELRCEIESLLQAHDASGSFLQEPSARTEATIDYPGVAERPGTTIGPYKLMEQIGEGGFGLVFVAEQQQPMRRKVALKVIKPGMDTREVIARFEAERQALALMDHPHIAKVLDAGTTQSGRPYFVMELVRGVPINEYCDASHLTPRARLELFIHVCQAVQHAHQKGVIHRDLKPSNILVAPHDGVPVVKVIDFGVAKALGQQLTDKTVYTRFAQMIGTPLYMSPEQAEVNALDVDTRSDVYSLGVLLYELLTGTTPFDKSRLALAAFDEIRRIIREEEPARPSTRVSTMGEGLKIVSTQRSTDPKKLGQLLRGDLDVIVMKALEKERGRRYDTPNALAEDIRRFLNQETIVARPASTAYRLRRFVQRNWLAVGASAAIAGALLLGLGISTWLAIRERQQRQVAETARQDAASQRAIAERERDEAQRQRDQAAALNTSLQRQQERQRRTLYVAQLNLIQKAWDSDNLARVRELLNATRPRPGEEDLRGFEWHYWQRRMHPEERALKIPIPITGSRGDVAFSHDGRQIALLTTIPPVVKVWDTTSGRQLFEKTIPPDVLPRGPTGGTFTARDTIALVDSERVAVIIGRMWRGASGGTARLHVFRFDSGEETFSKRIPFREGSPDQCFLFSRDGSRVAASLSEPFVQVWDGFSGQEIAKVPVPPIPGASRTVEILALSPNGSKLAVKPGVLAFSGPIQGITIAEVGVDKTVTTPPLHATRLEFSPDGTRLAATDSFRPGVLGTGTRITVFDTGTGRQQYSLTQTAVYQPWRLDTERGLSNPTLRFSPDGSWLALTTYFGQGDGTLQLWNAATGEAGPEFKGYASVPLCVAFSADGSKFLSAHRDGSVIAWPLPPAAKSSAERAQIIPTEGRWPSSSPDGHWLATTPFVPVVNPYSLRRTAAAETPLAVPEVRLTDTRGQVAERAFPFAVEEAAAIFSSNSAYLMAVGVKHQGELAQAAELKVWEVAAGRELLSLRMPATELKQLFPRIPWISSSHVTWSPDGRRLAIAVPDGMEKGGPPSLKIQVWDLASGRELLPRDKQPAVAFPSNRLEYNRDGDLLLSLARPIPAGAFERRLIRHLLAEPSGPLAGVQVWDASTGRLLWEDPRPVSAVSSDDGSYVAGIVGSGGQRQAVIWKASTGMEMGKCSWDANQLLTELAVSPDGNRVALANGKDVTVFDRVLGTELFTLSGHAGEILAVSFSSDGQRIATSAGERKELGRSYFSQRIEESREVKVWDAATGQELLALEVPWGDSAAGAVAGGVSLELTPHALRLASGPSWDAAPLSPETAVAELLQANQNVVQQPGRLTEAYEQALRYLEEACAIDPSSREAWSQRALAHYRLGQWAEVLAALARSEQLHTAQKLFAPAEDLTLQAIAQHHTGQRDQALIALELARSSHGRDEDFLQKLLTEAETLLAIPQAAAAPQRWIGRKVMPRFDSQVQNAIGETVRPKGPYRICKVEGDRLWFGGNSISRTQAVLLEGAVRYYSHLIQSEPGKTAGYTYRGDAWRELGEFDKAIEDYSAAIRLAPSLPGNLINRGRVWHEDKHDLDLALADFDTALQLAPDSASALVERGKVRRKLGALDDALKDLDQAIRWEPDLGFAYSCRAYVWSAQGDRAKMLQDLEEGIHRTPDDPNVWRLKAWLLATSPNAEHRDGMQATAAATKACELTGWGDHPELDALAAAYAETGDYEQAISWEEKAIAQTPLAKRPDYEARLRLYRAGKPYREPAAPLAADRSRSSTEPTKK